MKPHQKPIPSNSAHTHNKKPLAVAMKSTKKSICLQTAKINRCIFDSWSIPLPLPVCQCWIGRSVDRSRFQIQFTFFALRAVCLLCTRKIHLRGSPTRWLGRRICRRRRGESFHFSLHLRPPAAAGHGVGDGGIGWRARGNRSQQHPCRVAICKRGGRG